MKTKILSLLVFLSPIYLLAQADDLTFCPSSHESEFLHGNNVKALLLNNGRLFFDLNSPGSEGYQVEGDDILTQLPKGLWMGGYEAGTNNLKTAATTYSDSDYWPGPLNEEGTTDITNCGNWDRFWTVRRMDIRNHLFDYFGDDFIDDPIDAIMAWPGHGNPHFADIHGFELPDTPAGLAPFMDANGNGIYDPLNGDFPFIENSERIPEQIMWCVFNDDGDGQLHQETFGVPLKMEIQMTAWAFYCENNEVINNTIFTSHKFINRDETAIDSFHVGIWQDIDIGCHTDDGVGCNSDLNTIFSYNLYDSDAPFTSGCIGQFTENPPVTSTTILNRNLDHSMYYVNGSIGNPQFNITDPYYALEYFNYLTGSWRNGAPLTHGGIGNDTANSTTNLVFPDDPNDPLGWSMLAENLEGYDARSISSVNFNSLSPGEYIYLDLAHSYHRGLNSTNLDNVTLMYDEIAQIQAEYDNQFNNDCEQPTCISTVDDCVWPGDTNRDDIVNHCDLLPLAVAFEQSGANRTSLNFWAPWFGDTWDDDINGVNNKHTDCNGSGQTNIEDIDLIEEHYGFVTPFFQATNDIYQEGPEIIIESGGSVDPANMELGQYVIIRAKLAEVPELFGLACQLEFDSRYFQVLDLLAFTYDDIGIASEIREDGNLRIADFAMARISPDDILEEGNLFVLAGVTLENYNWTLPSNETTIRLKNIKGIRADGSEMDIGATSLTLTFPGVVISDVEENIIPELKVFPNPTTGVVDINLPKGEIDEIWITDVLGKKIKHEIVASNNISVNLNDQVNGLYFLTIKSGNAIEVEKIILAK